MEKTIKPGTRVKRAMTLDRAVDAEQRTVKLAFSSEQPYDRWWGIEILDHSPGSVRLGRLRSGAPLLIDHENSIRSQVGVIESVEIGEDRVGRAVVRFGRDDESEKVFQKVQDGIVRNVSVGYQIHKAVLESVNGDRETYRVTDWEPLEVSLVAVPADTTVGVGRSADEDSPIMEIRKEKEMSDVNVEVVKREAAEAAAQDFAKRTAEIIKIGEMFAKFGGEKLAAEALRNGKTVEEFKQMILEKVASAPQPTAEIGMTEKEARRFNFIRAINALANPGDRKAQEAAAFEREASEAVAQRVGKPAQGMFVPFEVQKRDLTVGTPGAGGHTVDTVLLAESFIDLLRNAMALTSLGARYLTGLVGNIAIPRQTGAATAYWVAESGAPTESQQAFDQVAMSPKTVGAFTDISRKLLLQSSLDIEAFVRRDLATVLALEIDRAAIAGSGASNQPRGIINTSGIGSVAGGANGAVPTWANMIDLETQVAIANAAIGSLAYLTNAKVRGKLKTVQKVATYGNDFVWETMGNGEGMVNGYRAVVSNQVPSNLTKGSGTNLSAIIFGNWNDLIVGQWGTLDLMVDPYTASTSGTVRVVALQDVDIAVRHPESFSAMVDAITA
jgi:HK97 family phage major capsid protein/HK97 family phage prohead protease